MKRILLALLMIGALFTSCSKDKEATTKDKLVGKWNGVTFTYKYTSPDGEITTDTSELESGNSVTFNSNGTFKSISVDGTDAEEVNGSWALTDDGKLIITIPNDEGGTYTINTLTSNQLVLYLKDTSEGDVYEVWLNFKK